MPHDTSLIATIAAGLVLAFAFGFLATRLRLPPLVGYLLAGVVIGPFTPGFVGDIGLAGQLAEIGVILLMFGVGLHFSVRDLMAVRGIAIPGAIGQIATATAIGLAMTLYWDWSLGAGLVFGLSLSVASTVVLLRALEQRNALQSSEGRIAIGWLIVEDLAMVLALVLLPALADVLGGSTRALTGQVAPTDMLAAFGLTFAKVALFVALALVFGTRIVPWLLTQVARTGSRELFTLAVLATALGIAYGSAALFGVSFALGAFFAGVILSESELSHKAGADSLPLQDAFAVLFFVSVGMLFDPSIVMREPLAVLAVLAVILVGKSVAAFVIVLAFGYPARTALTVSAALAQIGEFSFILAGLGIALGLLPTEGRDLILAGALLSITLNPLTFAGIGPIMAWLEKQPRLLALLESRHRRRAAAVSSGPVPSTLENHAILIGFGRVGSTIGRELHRHGTSLVVIEHEHRLLAPLVEQGIPVIEGDASLPRTLESAGLHRARLLVIAIPDGFQARRVLEIARAARPDLDVVVRAHSEPEMERLESMGVGLAVMGERELAVRMLSYACASLGVAETPRPGTAAPLPAELR
ncbi:MAG: YbaL family putative K(+) efflux transporter [Steroidobacteraceae bacterium]|nr:Kef family K(+) transporter [Nevskiaceae bacterium]MCP5471429.1 Kef family K(+) transporter [Nevskiaceae bacterium]